MHAAAGVPRARMQVAVVLHGPAGRIRCGTRRTKPDSASKTRTCRSSTSAGTRDTLRYVGELVSGDQPSSARRRDAGVAPQRAGRTGSLKDLDRVLHRSWRMARPGRASVTFGAPLSLTGQDYASLASASPRPSCDRSLRGSIEDTRNEIASSERADSVWDCPSWSAIKVGIRGTESARIVPMPTVRRRSAAGTRPPRWWSCLCA